MGAQGSSLLLLLPAGDAVLCLFNEVKDGERVLVSSALLGVQISISWQPYTAICLQVVSMLARQGFFLDGCLFSVLISSLILSLALEYESRLPSGFKGKHIPSLSSDLGTDAFECRLGFCEALTSMILEDIFAL